MMFKNAFKSNEHDASLHQQAQQYPNPEKSESRNPRKTKKSPNPEKPRIQRSRKTEKIQIQERPKPKSRKNRNENPRSLTLKNPNPLSFRKVTLLVPVEKRTKSLSLRNSGGFLFYVSLSFPFITWKYLSSNFYRRIYCFSWICSGFIFTCICTEFLTLQSSYCKMNYN